MKGTCEGKKSGKALCDGENSAFPEEAASPLDATGRKERRQSRRRKNRKMEIACGLRNLRIRCR